MDSGSDWNDSDDGHTTKKVGVRFQVILARCRAQNALFTRRTRGSVEGLPTESQSQLDIVDDELKNLHQYSGLLLR